MLKQGDCISTIFEMRGYNHSAMSKMFQFRSCVVFCMHHNVSFDGPALFQYSLVHFKCIFAYLSITRAINPKYHSTLC